MARFPEAEVLLARGWWSGDNWERRVLLRPEAEVEESLFDRIAEMLPVERDTTLIANLVFDRNANAIGMGRARELSLGDRTRLLLSLRRQMFGNAMSCTLRCPECREPMDVDLMADDLVLKDGSAPQLHYEDVVEVDGERLCVTFHVPTGGEVERAVRSARGAAERAAKLLAQGCVDRVTKTDGAFAAAATIEPEDWPERLYGEVSARMERLDSQAELRMHLSCPACSHDFEAFLDAGEYLFRELAARQRSTYQEIHQLAKAYHWSEADLLKMGSRKRRLYLELLEADNA